MYLNNKRFYVTASVLSLGAFTLAGCEDIGSLTDLGNKVDPIPGQSQQVKKTVDRPSPDSRGVITYPNYQIMVAKRGDTMASMASKVGISADALAKHNGLSPDHALRTGEVLSLPSSVSRVATVTTSPQSNSIEDIASSAIDEAPNTPANVPVATGDAVPLRHVVEPGETAYTIARLYNVSVTALASWNGLDRNLSVREGQQLLIPVADEQASQATAVAPVAVASNSSSAPATSPTPAPKPTQVAAAATVSSPGQGSVITAPPSAKKALPKPVEAVKPPESPKMAETQTAEASSSRKLLKPVNGKVLRGFSSKAGGNEGIDFGAPAGTAVKAAENGTVALISKSVSDTTIILIRHPDNLYTVYSNVGSAGVKKGDKVSRGQNIGKVAGGSPAFVHFEVRRGTEAVDPAPYL